MRRWGPEKWLLAITSVLLLVTGVLLLIAWIGGQPNFYRYAFRCAIAMACIWTVPFLVAMLFAIVDNSKSHRN